MALDNRSGVPVKSIEVGLERDIMLQEEPGCVASQHGFRELCSKHATAAGVPAGAAAERCVRVGVPVELAQQPSMHGKLIRCEYFVRATLKMGLLAENVHIKIPVHVQAAQGSNSSGRSLAAALQKLPSNWQPTQVLPPVVLTMLGAPAPADDSDSPKCN